MAPLPFPYSAGFDSELSRTNPVLNFVRSKAGAALLLVVALLQPVEVFSANCSLEQPLYCTDSTPCKTISDTQVCLAGVSPLPAGALQSTQTCWTAQGTYSCVQATSVNDTCGTLRADPTCGVVNSTCSDTDPATGNCMAYTDTYQCQTGGGINYTQTDCSGQTYCANGTCFTKKDKPNNALANVAAGMELARQGGFYQDPATGKIFGGVSSWCSQNSAGIANCCKPNKDGASMYNAIIVDQLVKAGWNAWVKDVVGTGYTFDTLFDTAAGYFDRAVTGMQDVLNGTTQATGATVVGASPAGPTVVPATQPAGASIGGMIGGQAGSMLAGNYAADHGANTAWAGTAAAAGYGAGTVAGTYAGAAVVGGAQAVVNGGSLFTGASDAMNLVRICVECIVAAMVIMVIMAVLACDPNEAKTQLRLGAGLCYHVGSYCSTKILGACATVRQSYCCFNSKLARIVQEQGRPQLGKDWGDVKSPDCAGFTTDEVSALDFSKMDLSEFVADVTARATPDGDQLAASAVARVNEFYSSGSPSVTNGVIPPPPAGVPVPITIVDTSASTVPAVAMPACNVSLSKQNPTSTGNITGTFHVTNCLANGTAVWSNVGTCPAIPATTQSNALMTPIDAAGNTSATFTVPSSCFASSTPAIFIGWKAMIADPQAGALGSVPAYWQ